MGMRGLPGLLAGAVATALLVAPIASAARRGAKSAGQAVHSRQRPPLCPRWALRPWVWDDRGDDSDFACDDRNAHHTAAVRALVDGYRRRGIPVGTVVIDSPWETNYNTCQFDPRRYEDPRGLVQEMHDQGVRVVLWLTAIMAPGGAVFEDELDFRDALNGRMLILKPDQGLEHWWKGQGGLIDFYNPLAVRWWHQRMDRALDLGIDGWKVDKVEASLPEIEESLEPGAENPTIQGYRQRYFHDTYRYLLRRRPDGVVIQRPFYTSTVADTSAAWAGDQPHSWRGLRSALRLVLGGARVGNAVVGSDIGGYLGGNRPDKTLYLRWAQFGALCPLMETGGTGERRPWKIDEETVAIFRYYATLHTELIPYFYTWMAETHLTGRRLLQSCGADRGEYLLGPDVFVSVVMQPGGEKEVRLPPGEWVDYWEPARTYHGPVRLPHYSALLGRLPLFIRQGAIVPLETSAERAWGRAPDASLRPQPGAPDGALTLAIFPVGATVLRYRYETGPQAFGEAVVRVNAGPAGVTVTWLDMPRPVLLSVRTVRRPREVRGDTGAGSVPLPERTTREALESVDRGWSWDAATGQAWVKPGAAGVGTVTLRVDEGARRGG
jgi:alpha-glucosidase (family GH31 glycosyl hydrolase)